ncbi:MAG TPA: metal-dependent hydrolase [Flavobacteriaceae bacterium]|nr:metal-dependent hydrolase [Flavobacteriaceae bacterium]
MASIFGHALASIAIGSSFTKTMRSLKFWLLGVFCAIFPDADVVGFKFGIKYASFFGHRGFTHSLVFALLFGFLIAFIFYNKKKKFLYYAIFFTLATVSHSVLDAMTTGGLGVAFFSPFDNTRYFFSWRPIQVSPIGVAKFFSSWGLRVLKSELIWIGLPSLVYILLLRLKKYFIK